MALRSFYFEIPSAALGSVDLFSLKTSPRPFLNSVTFHQWFTASDSTCWPSLIFKKQKDTLRWATARVVLSLSPDSWAEEQRANTLICSAAPQVGKLKATLYNRCLFSSCKTNKNCLFCFGDYTINPFLRLYIMVLNYLCFYLQVFKIIIYFCVGNVWHNLSCYTFSSLCTWDLITPLIIFYYNSVLKLM